MSNIRLSLVSLIFFSALFIAIALSVPALNINDEWITVNQLHQLGSGHQVIQNEGKYGSFLSGDNTPYFLERHNILGYSLALPIFSLPVLFLFTYMDSAFRLSAIIIASGCLLIAGIILLREYPDISSFRGKQWPWILIISGFLLFIINMLFFTPFYAHDPYPVEVAAVVFTEHILFAILAVIFFLIVMEIFHDQWFGLFGTMALISCSSFLYWTTNAKDHLLTAVFFALTILFFIRYLQGGFRKDAFFSFLFCGFLIWIRPEMGITTYAAILLFFLYDYLFHVKTGSRFFFKTVLSIASGTILGILPFLLNNRLVTGHPFIPIFLVYSGDLLGTSVGWGDINTTMQEIGGSTVASRLESVTPGGFINPFHGLFSFFSPKWGTMIHDLTLILFAPETGMMSIMGMTPLFLVGIAIIPVILFLSHRIDTYRKKVLFFSILLVISVFVTYMRNFPDLSLSEGIGPDIRYLSPLYIPGGILGLFALYYGISCNIWRKIFPLTAFFCLTGCPLIIISLLLLQPLGGGFIEYTYTLSLAGILIAGLTTGGILLSYLKNSFHKPLYLFIPLLCVFPLSWQLMVVFLFSITKFNGYPFWLPLVEHVYSMFIIPVG